MTDERFEAEPGTPFVFGRADADGVVGLDPTDMGISAVAGSVESAWGVWWVVNRSRKRRLLLESAPGLHPQRLQSGDRQAVTVPRLAVLVPGAVYTHRIEVRLPRGSGGRPAGRGHDLDGHHHHGRAHPVRSGPGGTGGDLLRLPAALPPP